MDCEELRTLMRIELIGSDIHVKLSSFHFTSELTH